MQILALFLLGLCVGSGLTAEAKTKCTSDALPGRCDCTHQNINKTSEIDCLNTTTFIDLTGNELTTLDAGAFKAYPNLTTLILAENKLKTINKTAFENIQLTTLDLSHNDFDTIPDDGLTGQGKLTILVMNNLKTSGTLKNTEIVMLGEVFNDLTSLSTLSLFGLGYKSTNASSFSQVSSTLTHLLMAQNQLGTIGDDTFKNLTNLVTLNLQGNKLKTLSAAALNGLNKLTSLDISDNHFETFPKTICQTAKTLKIITINGFMGSKLAEDALVGCKASLTTFTMQKSSIKDIGTAFANLTALATLDLSSSPKLAISNKAAFLNVHALTKLSLRGMGTKLSTSLYELPQAVRSLKPSKLTLDVSGSRFVTFNQNDTDFFSKLTTMNATFNPYDCGCKNVYFIVWFQENTEKNNTLIPDTDRGNYTCSTCEQCEKVPTPVKSVDAANCDGGSSSVKKSHVIAYAVGMAAVGLVIGVVATLAVVFLVYRRRKCCFSGEPYRGLGEE